ncbi:MAG: tetratricopeptide repeat protein, partial [Paracoccaceae bacterium]|nr:tetratricopeptide repeat protein [Paracoccaceae bacterium]
MPLLLAATVALSGCYSKKERAQQHYEAAISLLGKGDMARAVVELRNVFQLDPAHHDARATYARLLLKEGRRQEAFTQFQRLVEQYPRDLEGNRTLAELALDQDQFDLAQRYFTTAAAISPKDPGTEGVGLSLRYHAALQSGDATEQANVVAAARTLLTASPDVMTARRIVIDAAIRAKDWKTALEATDAGLKQAPEDALLAQFRLGLLARLGDDAATEAQLKDMVTRFPKDATLPRALVAWYVEHGKLDLAEAFLRSRIDPASQDPAARLALVQFLDLHRGRAAAEAELKRALAAAEPTDKTALVAVQAGYDFTAGHVAQAIAALKQVVGQEKPTPTQAAAAVLLARMQDQSGDHKGAQATVDAVLKADPNQIDAIRLKAGWLIDEDHTGDALVLLRSGLSVAPKDPGLLDVMARAYARDGNPGLERDTLRQAVDATGHAPAQVLRYVEVLMRAQDYAAADQTLTTALALHPKDPSLLAALGNLHVTRKDWASAEDDLRRLSAIGSPQAQGAAEVLKARILAGQNDREALTTYLQGLAQKGGATGVDAQLALIVQDVKAGQMPQALDKAVALRGIAPDDPRPVMIQAAILMTLKRGKDAVAELSAALTRMPKQSALWAELYRITAQTGGNAAADDVLARGLAELPQDRSLLWLKAGALEQAGDAPGAIAIYEKLYQRASDNPVIANNLASLLASSRTDAESLARAATIARRLQDSAIPAFQDTVGW